MRVRRFLDWWRIGRLQPRGVHFKEETGGGASSPKPRRKLTLNESKDLASRDDFDENLRSIFVRHRIALAALAMDARALLASQSPLTFAAESAVIQNGPSVTGQI